MFWRVFFPRLLFLSGFNTLQRVWCIPLWPNGSWDRLQGREGGCVQEKRQQKIDGPGCFYSEGHEPEAVLYVTPLT